MCRCALFYASFVVVFVVAVVDVLFMVRVFACTYKFYNQKHRSQIQTNPPCLFMGASQRISKTRRKNFYKIKMKCKARRTREKKTERNAIEMNPKNTAK